MNEEQDDIRVVVVDDHLVVREGLRMMLEITGEGFTLLGDAADGAAAVRLVEELQPDVVLMDLRMPKMDTDRETLFHAIRAAARGDLLLHRDHGTYFGPNRLYTSSDALETSSRGRYRVNRVKGAPSPLKRRIAFIGNGLRKLSHHTNFQQPLVRSSTSRGAFL